MTEREGKRRSRVPCGSEVNDFGAIQLTIDERYDYITVIRVKGDPLRAHTKFYLSW